MENLNHEPPALTAHQAAVKMGDICANCKLWKTPACYERRDYKRDAGPNDWCWGHRRGKK